MPRLLMAVAKSVAHRDGGADLRFPTLVRSRLLHSHANGRSTSPTRARVQARAFYHPPTPRVHRCSRAASPAAPVLGIGGADRRTGGADLRFPTLVRSRLLHSHADGRSIRPFKSDCMRISELFAANAAIANWLRPTWPSETTHSKATACMRVS